MCSILFIPFDSIQFSFFFSRHNSKTVNLFNTENWNIVQLNAIDFSIQAFIDSFGLAQVMSCSQRKAGYEKEKKKEKKKTHKIYEHQFDCKRFIA